MNVCQRVLVGCVVVGAMLTTGCGKAPPPPPVVQAPTPPVQPPPPAPPAPKPITLAKFKPVALLPGGQATVEVSVERNGNAGPIQLRVENSPAGITANAQPLAAEASAGTLVLAAAPELGDAELAANLSVTAELGNLKSTEPLSVKVAKLNLPSFAPVAEVLLQPGTRRTLELGIQRQGFQGPLELRVEGTLPHLTCTAAPIAAETDTSRVEIAATYAAPNGTHKLRVTATPHGRTMAVEVPVAIEAQPFQVKSLQAVTLQPGQTQQVEVVVERGSYQGPLQLEAVNLPHGLTVKATEVPAGQTKAVLEIAAGQDAPLRVGSAKIVSKAGHLTTTGPIVIRISGTDETYLPPAIVNNPDTSALLRRGSIGGRLTAESKQALLEFYGGTPESEAAVRLGLQWLAAHQQPDGSWLLDKYGQNISGCNCQTAFESKLDNDVTAGTALAVLPFLGAGVTSNRAPQEPAELASYQEVVKKALLFLASKQVRSKDKKDKQDGNLGGSMYAHAAGTIAFCEAYGLSGDEQMKLNAQLALKYLVQAQHAKGGGWRYGPGQEGDMSVTGWVILGVRSAQLAGIMVLKDPLERAGRFLDNCSGGPEGAKKSRYSYLPDGEPTLPLSAAGLLTRQYLGWPKDEAALAAGCKYLMENLPPESGDKLGPIYYYYYATQVLHHMEGPNFDLWNHRMREHLLRTQVKSGHATGSWNPEGTDYGNRGGRLYTTSMALITLQVYYRHLPMYRHVKRSA